VLKLSLKGLSLKETYPANFVKDRSEVEVGAPVILVDLQRLRLETQINLNYITKIIFVK
jgi:hypothetical protein